VVAVVACLAGPVAYAAQTVTTAHTGSVPSAGPSSGSGFGGAGGMPGAAGLRATAAGGSSAAATGTSSAAGGRSHASASGAPSGGIAAGGQTQTSAALVKALEAGAGRYRWVAAVSGSQSAATLELATGGDPVMAIGGFNGEGGHLSLAQFKRYVAAGEIHYYIASTGLGAGGLQVGSGRGGASSTTGGPPSGTGPSARGSAPGVTGARPGGAGFAAGTGRAGAGAGGPGGYSASSITSWVKAHYQSVSIGGQTVYDLRTPK